MTNTDLISAARAVVNRTIPSQFFRRLVVAVTLTVFDLLVLVWLWSPPAPSLDVDPLWYTTIHALVCVMLATLADIWIATAKSLIQRNRVDSTTDE